MDCISKLKNELKKQLKAAYTDKEMKPTSLKELEQAYAKDENAYGLAVKVLDLPDPKEGRGLLKKMLISPHGLVGIEAASVLAILGFKDGLDNLLVMAQPLTNSQIEYFYVKASLLLLEEKIPKNLKGKDSVFPELTSLIRECSGK